MGRAARADPTASRRCVRYEDAHGAARKVLCIPADNTVTGTDLQKFYAAGFAEGYLTASHIHDHYMVWVRLAC